MKDILIWILGIGMILILAALIVVWVSDRKRLQEWQKKVADKEELDSRRKYELQSEIFELDRQIAAKYKELNDANKNYKVREEELRAVYENANKEMKAHASIFAAEVDNYRVKLEEVRSEYNELVQRRDRLNEEFIVDSETSESLHREIEKFLDELMRLKEDHRLAVLASQNDVKEGLWELQLRSSELELIKILERIKIDYPELKNDISTIEWKKIWLPKLQDLCGKKELDGKCGIYRLVLKKDDKVCYVGQAVNIKERWYQHVKKMIGVEAKGGEKLYEWRPEDFWWSVLEECESGELNGREKYWIEFYACKEVGLNKKA